MEMKRCAACDQVFQPRPQVPAQSYCSLPDCQKERRRRWQQEKLRTDQDYRDNQARAQKAWLERNPDYWREYRSTHEDYVERNRAFQRTRNAQRNNSPIAKMDVSPSLSPLTSGIYRMSPVEVSEFAKIDVWTVQITVLSTLSEPRPKVAKR
jgi:hypothetical protein